MPPRTAEAADALSSVRREKLIWFSPCRFFVLVRRHPIRTRRRRVIRHLASGLLQCPTAAAISGALEEWELRCGERLVATGRPLHQSTQLVRFGKNFR